MGSLQVKVEELVGEVLYFRGEEKNGRGGLAGDGLLLLEERGETGELGLEGGDRSGEIFDLLVVLHDDFVFQRCVYFDLRFALSHSKVAGGSSLPGFVFFEELSVTLFLLIV